MSLISNKELLESLTNRCERIEREASKYLLTDPGLMSSKPSENAWSTYEVFHHMGLLYGIYLTNIKKTLAESVHTRPSTGFRHGLIGNYLIRTMTPNQQGQIPRPMKTFRIFEPNETKIGNDEVSKFLEMHKKFRSIVNNIPGMDLEKMKVTSSIGSVIRFKMGDVLLFVTGHNERHLIQASSTLSQIESGGS